MFCGCLSYVAFDWIIVFNVQPYGRRRFSHVDAHLRGPLGYEWKRMCPEDWLDFLGQAERSVIAVPAYLKLCSFVAEKEGTQWTGQTGWHVFASFFFFLAHTLGPILQSSVISRLAKEYLELMYFYA